jgi:hypothetical protein
MATFLSMYISTLGVSFYFMYKITLYKIQIGELLAREEELMTLVSKLTLEVMVLTSRLEALSSEKLLVQKELNELLTANSSLLSYNNLVIFIGIVGVIGIVATIGSNYFVYSKIAAGIVAVNQQHANSLAGAHEILRSLIIKNSSNESILKLITKISDIASKEAEIQASISALNTQQHEIGMMLFEIVKFHNLLHLFNV